MYEILKPAGIMLLLILLISANGFGQTSEQVTITTYYPSPYGAYQGLEGRRVVIGQDTLPTQDGLINFQGLAADPTFNNAGTMYYNSTSNVYRYYNGTAWRNLGGCTRYFFTASSGLQRCPVGTAIPLSPVAPSGTSGTFLCCSY